MPNYRIEMEVDGKRIFTLKDILPNDKKLKALFIGKVPTLKSVNEGHYFQGRQGTMFWNKLIKYELFKVSPGSYEDENLLENKYGIVDIAKIPKEYGNEPSKNEYVNGAKRILDVIDIYKPMVIVFIYKKVLDKLLKYAFNIDTKAHYGFNNNLEDIFNCKVFVFPMPGTLCRAEDGHKYMMELKNVLSNDKINEEDILKQQMKERYDEEEKNFKEVTLNDLMCKDCSYAYPHPQLITVCKEYSAMKPGKVLYGGNCDKYNKDNFLK